MFETHDAKDKHNTNDKKNLLQRTDEHIPQFDFTGYPQNPKQFESSPRILDETWQRYRKQSLDTAGASALRCDSDFLDRIIQIFQMVPQDFKDTAKKHQIQAALEVLANVVKNGSAADANLDVTRSSSLPTLLISIVRALVKATDVKVPELMIDLLHGISVLCRNGFSKAVGIESIYMKAFIPLLPQLIKDDNPDLRLALLKAVGTFASLAVVIPIRC